ncbi:hypothetical protein KY290_030941 [Solanum tuberosum]|uniref:Uncharacterized protein n=1 Tax=Solanum tuberosum TaxID=4113 RepID=A0ABQ7U827_SOLTU|nr:hypothetical protein KY285_030030 [Solanum tuberosum]KAH0742948.1 hypothetical protein KY290_030941 [Solanum tuberosum]
MTEERRSKHIHDPIHMQNLPQVKNIIVESSSISGNSKKDDENQIVDEEKAVIGPKGGSQTDFAKNDVGAISEREAPPRHNMPHIVHEDSETIVIYF